MAKKEVPHNVLATAPYLEFVQDVYHPEMGTPPGRPPAKYTPAVRDVIVEKIRNGMRPEQAALLAGISSSAFHDWMKKGREGHVHLWEFADAVERALAEYEEKAVVAIAGPDGSFLGDSENAKWMLERRFAATYNKDGNQKFQAAMEDFFMRLEGRLPTEVFQMVLAAAAGEDLAINAKPVFKLLPEQNEEVIDACTEEDETGGEDTARQDAPEVCGEVQDQRVE